MQGHSHTATPTLAQRLAAFAELCKPRVNSLIVFTAMIGMLLPARELPPLQLFLVASLGIGLVACAAAAINCLVERTIDALMARTRARATARGEASTKATLTLAFLLGGAGLWLLHSFVNELTMWLTFATFVGYAVIYTALLKPMTPMNIVIGGASGAMPPVLGWAAMTGSVSAEPLALFLIIFLWTPPHFWSLACYRIADYEKSGLPMLPVTHGIPFTCQHILLYTFMMAASTVVPFTLGMSGWFYLAAVTLLNLGFIAYAVALYRKYSDALAKRTFRYSIVYLTLLFAALFADRLFA
ncbi:MAG: protoheme IX farnesyltransferase [Rhodocyclales bacterium]|nr:protoheme IX farnesyltransferase [Rhodocyclales bacterium]